MDGATGILTTPRNLLPHMDYVEQPDSVFAARHLLESFAFQFGRSYDSYLATEPGRQRFWAKNGRGVVVFVRLGKYLNVVGGLLADAEDKQSLLAEFVDYAQQRNLLISFYNIATAELPLFRQYGFQVTKWGEDAWIDLQQLTWKGKPYEWVRRQSNYCLRHGICFSECIPEQLTAEAWNDIAQQLEEISASRLATRPQTVEMNFLDGRFDAEGLGRRRLFIASSAERIEGFLICNPCLNGTEWALDVYRQRSDGVRGTIAFLIHQTLQQLKEEGIERASLCLIPSLRCRRLPRDSRLIRWGLILGRQFTFIFDTAGLYHFKSRFRPEFEDRYVCVYPKATLGSVCAFTRLCGVLDLSPRKVLAGMWRRITKCYQRSTLAKPNTQAE
jgi:phosphatidylglycerol lysyltransferase